MKQLLLNIHLMKKPTCFKYLIFELYKDCCNFLKFFKKIGRSSESSIDFIVLDTILPSKDGKDSKQSTISRFACRIIVDRDPPHTARIYAAGFDGSRHIFLGVFYKTIHF